MEESSRQTRIVAGVALALALGGGAFVAGTLLGRAPAAAEPWSRPTAGATHGAPALSPQGSCRADAAVTSGGPPVAAPVTERTGPADPPVAAPRPTVARAPATPAPERLQVRRLVVTRAIERREPVPVESIALEERPLYAFLELANAAADAQAVVVTFEREGGPSVGHVVLTVPPETRRWRTWALTRGVKRSGEWTAVVRSIGGVELARRTFFVGA